MELEYGLIAQALELIRKIGQDFAINNKKGEPRWLNYKKTPQYRELEQLLQKDYSLLTLYNINYIVCLIPVEIQWPR